MRQDPFFASKKPHSNGYLESLHRTYGEAKGFQLPTREDGSFARALQFRKNEKEHYAKLQDELTHTRAEYEQLAGETQKIRTLFEQLSKLRANEQSATTDSESRGVRARRDGGRRGDEGVDQPAEHNASGSADHGDSSVPEPKAGGVGDGEERVHDEVLPGGDSPRQAVEHPVEGSEPGNRVGSSKNVADESDGGRESPS